MSYNNKRYQEIRAEVIAHYGGKCFCCGILQKEFLCVDHSFTSTDKEHRSGTNIIRWIYQNKFPSGFRILCHNCNSSLGFYGFCPHNATSKRELKKRGRLKQTGISGLCIQVQDNKINTERVAKDTKQIEIC